jgi:hypothetical protein
MMPPSSPPPTPSSKLKLPMASMSRSLSTSPRFGDTPQATGLRHLGAEFPHSLPEDLRPV